MFAGLGITDVRLTGGEPLVRRDFPRAGRDARARSTGIDDLSVTTNGYLLERDAAALVEAGIDRVNVSIDSLARDRFHRDHPPRRAAADAARPRGDRCLSSGSARSRSTRSRCATSPSTRSSASASSPARADYQVRFIEFMPLDGDRAWDIDQVLTGARDPRADRDQATPLVEQPREPHATARVYRFADGPGEIGFINPVSEPFCGDCNRIRLTADGKLRTCLFSIGETDLREPLRAGADRRRARDRSSATPSGARSSSTTSTSPASSHRRAR